VLKILQIQTSGAQARVQDLISNRFLAELRQEFELGQTNLAQQPIE
jgi:hypothetical protein